MSKNRQIANMLDKDSGAVKFNLIDSDTVVTSAVLGSAAVSAGTDVYTNLSDLPGSATTGAQAFVTSNNGLYIYNGSGWYKVALVNASPYWETEANTLYTFTIDTAITVTLLADDSDGHAITYTATADSDANTFITITKDSDNGRIFTLTPDSENEAPGLTNSGTVTFKASDGISFASTVSTFTLNFINVISNSASTLLLMKATGNDVYNSNITFLDSDGTSQSFTRNGTPQASTFTPYRKGGYSVYLADGSETSDYVDIDHDSSLNLTDSDFTIECWIYVNSWTNNDVVVGKWQQGSIAGVNEWLWYYSSAALRFLVSTNGQSSAFNISFGSPPLNQWNHLAATRSGNKWYTYLNGEQVATRTGTETIYTSSRKMQIGRYEVNGGLDGYVSDLRIVKGRSVYDSEFTPPTERLTAVTNTVLLTCQLPYLADSSSYAHTMTGFGGVETHPISPYDYEPWNSIDGGSVYFDGTGDYLVDNESADNEYTMGTGDFNFECWYYPLSIPAAGNHYLVAFGQGNVNDHEGFLLGVNTNGKVYGYIGSGSGWTSLTSGTAIVLAKTWVHLAISRSGTTLKIFVNGVEDQSTTNSTNIPNANNLIQIGGRVDSNGSTQQYATGHLADVRLDQGGAVRTAAFTPPTEPISSTSNTKLLMNNKTDANIYDAAAANTFQLINNTKASTTQRKFSTSSSIYFDGGDDRLQVQDFGLEDDLTVEGWFYQTATQSTSYRLLVGTSTYTSSTPFGLFTYNTQVQLWGLQSGVQITGSFTANTWHHVAVVRNSGTWTLYIDGTSQGTNTNNGTYAFADGTEWQWGCGPVSLTANDFTGYMQDWRISDRAVYTSNFTAPTDEFDL